MTAGIIRAKMKGLNTVRTVAMISMALASALVKNVRARSCSIIREPCHAAIDA